MDFLLIEGVPNTGKTEAINRLKKKFLRNKWKIIEERVFSCETDFRSVLEKDGKIVIIHSPSERESSIRMCKKLCDKYNPILLISGCRPKGDKFHTYFFEVFKKEIKQAKNVIEYLLEKVSEKEKKQYYAKIDADLISCLKKVFKIVLE